MVFKDKVMSSTYLRFLSRNKLYTFIEVFGLSVALGFVILLASYARTNSVSERSNRFQGSCMSSGLGILSE